MLHAHKHWMLASGGVHLSHFLAWDMSYKQPEAETLLFVYQHQCASLLLVLPFVSLSHDRFSQ